MFKRIAFFSYGTVAYIIFLGTFVYAAGFVGNILVPKSVDAAPTASFGISLLIDLLLLGVFAVQHSVMARPGFKRCWTRFVPQAIERSTYVLFASAALIALFAYWQPLGGIVWNVRSPGVQAILYALFTFGWLLVLVATFQINHFDLFGMRQVTLYLLGKEYTRLPFKTPALYRHVRHPLYVGFLFGFWATPTMTLTHLVFAVATTAYILIAIQLEERDLVAEHAEYADYRGRVPMVIPRFASKHGTSRSSVAPARA